MNQDDIQLLAKAPVCALLRPDEVRRLALAGRIERWSPGALVMEEGADGPRLIVILSGRVVVQKQDPSGTTHMLRDEGRGSVLGEMSLLTGHPRDASVTATEPLRVFAMDRTTFDLMVADNDPAALKLGLSIARVLAGRMEDLNKRFVELLEEGKADSGMQELQRFREELFARWDY